MFSTLTHDLRAGWRSLVRQPLFTLAAVCSLALGIGACAVVFSVVYALLLKPLPYPRPDELVQITCVGPTKGERDHAGLAPGALADLLAARPPVFTAFAGMAYDYINLTNVPVPEQLTVGLVTADYFRLYGVAPALGRFIEPADCRLSAPPVVVLGDKLWRSQFHAAPDIVGQSIMLGGKPRTVAGVMPAGFKEPQNVAEIWLPQPLDEIAQQPRTSRYLNVVGRLRDARAGTFAEGRAALAVAAANQAAAFPAENRGWTFEAQGLQNQLAGSDNREPLVLLLGAVMCVLLVACVNVANLQLVRASVRRREMGVRLALGASRGHLMRQSLTESFLLAGFGGMFGALLAAWGVDAVSTLLPAGYSPRQEEITLNLPVLLFAVGITALTGLISGGLPAWFASRQSPAGTMGSGGDRGSSESHGGVRTRGLLVTLEISLALVLLAGAGLMARTFYGLLRVPPGLRTERVLTMGLSLPEERYPDAPKRAEFYRRCVENVRQVPGVENVAFASTQPFNWTLDYVFTKSGQTVADAAASHQDAIYDAVNPEYFAALDLPIRRGRGFTSRDGAGAPLVVVVNEAFARQFFAGRDVLGERITLVSSARTPSTLEIIGVAADVRRYGLEKEPPAQMFTCYLQRPTTFGTLFVRAGHGITAESLTKGVQAAIAQVDSDQPLTNLSTLDKAVRNSVGSTRLYLALFMLFAGLTLVLAALGIYGTISYSVVQRTREIGIRLALGAQRPQVLRLVMGQAARLVGVGVAVGLAASLALGRLLGGLLYGVAPTDPATLACVALLLAGIALLASYLPAYRATRIDPLAALREE